MNGAAKINPRKSRFFHDFRLTGLVVGGRMYSRVRGKMNAKQEQQMMTMKSYFPFQIVWGKLDKNTGVFEVFANTTKHGMNKAVREGHKVWKV